MQYPFWALMSLIVAPNFIKASTASKSDYAASSTTVVPSITQGFECSTIYSAVAPPLITGIFSSAYHSWALSRARNDCQTDSVGICTNFGNDCQVSTALSGPALSAFSEYGSAASKWWASDKALYMSAGLDCLEAEAALPEEKQVEFDDAIQFARCFIDDRAATIASSLMTTVSAMTTTGSNSVSTSTANTSAGNAPITSKSSSANRATNQEQLVLVFLLIGGIIHYNLG